MERLRSLIGTTVSHYEILERLGGGGMGVVYKARDLRLGRLAALKFLSPRLRESTPHHRRLLREAQAASALDHPAICTVYEIGEAEDGQLFISMAFCEGETVKEKLSRGPLAPRAAIDIAIQVASGLAEAHRRGIVHRDVKPANVIVNAGGRLKIVDFGVAQLEDQTRLTRPGTAMGTAAYMAPEQLKGGTVDQRADVWAVGVLLYEMLTGRLPFQGKDDREIMAGVMHQEPEPLGGGLGALGAAAFRIVLRALAKNPDARFPALEPMIAELQTLAQGAQVKAESEELEITRIEPSTAGGSAGERSRLSLESTNATGFSGRIVAHYRILEQIGGGGMGVVYKAEDQRLGRTVALKFLPLALSAEAEAKERFLEEARAASALDHPNICTIHEVGETEDGRLYLSMPCYDGETLRGRLDRGPVPLGEALDIARQTALGLAKAHRQGIVHRDIKPANLMVTADGVVKILDFGVAKLVGAAVAAGPGPLIGTPAYMSPEQARGESVDGRADLWSLGVILYEMLAGRRAVRGDSTQAILYNLHWEAPEPLAEQRPDLPVEVTGIVDRLLEKDPEKRYATAGEVLADLQRLILPDRGRESGEEEGPPVRRRRWLAAGLLALLLAGIALVSWLAGRGTEESGPIDARFARLTDQEGRDSFPSLSPDGSRFIYTRSDGGDLDLFLRPVEGGEVINLTADSPADDTQPAFSPDGQWIAFRSERQGGGLFVMDTAGKRVRRLSKFGYNPAWSPDGRNLVCGTEAVLDPGVRRSNSELWRIDVATAAPTPLVRDDAVQPSWSPNGQRIAYWGLPQGTAKRVLWTVAADGTRPVQVSDDDYLNWNPVWSPDGRHLYFASDRGGSMNLWRLAIDEESGKVRGEPRPLLTPSPSSGWMSLSRDGRHILFAADDSRSNIETYSLDAATLQVSGGPRPVTQGTRVVRSADVSPDGRRLVYHSALPRDELFLVEADGTSRQLTDDLDKDRNPVWSRDGQDIFFYSNRGGQKKYEIWRLHLDDGALEQLTRSPGEALTSPVPSPDGRRLLCSLGSRAAALIDLSQPIDRRIVGTLPAAGSREEAFVPSSWSPDGLRVAGSVQRPDELPLPGLYLYSFATRTYERLIDHGALPVWVSDGERLLFIDAGRVGALDLRTRKSWEVLGQPPHASFTGVALSADSRSLYAVRSSDEGEIWMARLP